MDTRIESTIYEIGNDKVRVVMVVGNRPVQDCEVTSDDEAVEISILLDRVAREPLVNLRYHALEQARKIIEEARDRAHEIAQGRGPK